MSNTNFQGTVIYKEYNPEKSFIKLNIAVKNRMKGKDDVIYPCVAFKGTAESLNEHFDKGNGIVIERADFTSDKVTNNDGSYKIFNNFIINEFKFPVRYESKNATPDHLKEQEKQNNKTREQIKEKEEKERKEAEKKERENNESTNSQKFDDFDDDIPF